MLSSPVVYAARRFRSRIGLSFRSRCRRARDFLHFRAGRSPLAGSAPSMRSSPPAFAGFASKIVEDSVCTTVIIYQDILKIIRLSNTELRAEVVNAGQCALAVCYNDLNYARKLRPMIGEGQLATACGYFLGQKTHYSDRLSSPPLAFHGKRAVPFHLANRFPSCAFSRTFDGFWDGLGKLYQNISYGAAARKERHFCNSPRTPCTF